MPANLYTMWPPLPENGSVERQTAAVKDRVLEATLIAKTNCKTALPLRLYEPDSAVEDAAERELQ